MQNKVVGIFKDRSIVNSVLTELNNNGFDSGDISVLAKRLDTDDVGTSGGVGGIRTYSGGTTTYPETGVRNRDVVSDYDRTGTPIRDTSSLGTSRTNLNDDYPTGTGVGNYHSGRPVRGTEDISRPLGDTTDETWVNRGNVDRHTDMDRESVKGHYDEGHDVKDKDPNAMVKGASIGGALGLIGGLAALLVPGIGPVLAAGPLAAAITAGAGGAAIGATAGTILGLFKDIGIPGDRAKMYENHFDKGDVVVIVHTDENQLPMARQIINRFNPTTVDTF